MFRKIFNYLLTKLPIVKELNGRKTEIGFVLFVIGWLAEGLAGASGFFPHISQLVDATVALNGFYDAIVHNLESLGIGIGTVGLYHDKIKRS